MTGTANIHDINMIIANISCNYITATVSSLLTTNAGINSLGDINVSSGRKYKSAGSN